MLAIRTSNPPLAAALHLSPQRPGISGYASAPSGQPVPIGRLLEQVLGYYGLVQQPAAPVEEPIRQADAEIPFDVLA
jgi:hypothetical protein